MFFVVVAIELKNEMTVGQLNSIPRAIRPASAALGGVVVPALIYLGFTAGTEYQGGWPIPTATDIAFVLDVLAVFGRGIPSRLRILIPALAILDDLVAILIIAVHFTSEPNLVFVGIAVLGVAVFGVLSRFLGSRFRLFVISGMVAVGLVTWSLVYLSGIHATIAGASLGLAMARIPGNANAACP